MATYKRVQAVENAVAILDCIVEAKGGLRGLEVAKATGMNTSTCYSILHTLATLDLLSYDEKKKTFSEGVWFYEKYKKSALKLKAIPGLDTLFETLIGRYPAGVCTLWKIMDSRCVLVEKLAGQNSAPIRLAIGQRMPRYLGAFGRALAAVDGISSGRVEEVIASIDFEVKPTSEEFVSDMRFFLRNGYSLDRERYVNGITAISSLLFDADEIPVYAVSYVGHSIGLDDEQVSRIGVELQAFASNY